MTDHKTRAQEIPAGPVSWRICQAKRAGFEPVEGREALLYTDTNVTGYTVTECDGQYHLVNCLGSSSSSLSPSIALRVLVYQEFQYDDQAHVAPPPSAESTGTRYWLGMDVDAEIACILSLVFGIRLSTGGWTRIFDHDDPAGRAYYIEHTTPEMPRSQFRHTILPGLRDREVNLLASTGFLSSYQDLDGDQATALVRAARQYAEALWVAESDPELAWLFLVSALEIGADCWRSGNSTSSAILCEAMPGLSELLHNYGGVELLNSVADELKSIVKSTQRFLDFSEYHLPDAPSLRPDAAAARLDWADSSDIRKRLQVIYKHRSQRLHSGVPFPSPMVTPDRWGDYEEKPRSLGASTLLTSWTPDDYPITLYSMAHLTRGALLNWWREIDRSNLLVDSRT